MYYVFNRYVATIIQSGLTGIGTVNYLRTQAERGPLLAGIQIPEFPDLKQTLDTNLPIVRYPAEQETVHREP